MVIISIMEVKPDDEPLRVFSFVEPYQMNFLKSKFKTISEFQTAIKECFKIEVKDQIVIRNCKKMVLDGPLPFEKLPINRYTSIMVFQAEKVVPKPKVKVNKFEDEVSFKLQKLQLRKMKEIEVEQQRKQEKQIKQRLLFAAKEITVNEIITQFIKRLKLPQVQLLILNPPKLKFIVKKVTEGNPKLRELLLSRLNVVKLAFFNHSKIGINITTRSTLVPEQLNQLLRLNYQKEEAIKALELSKNCMETAISHLYHRFEICHVHSPQKQKKDLPDQYFNVYEQLKKKQYKTQILILKNNPAYLDVFLNSLKHTHPQLYTSILCLYHYMNSLIDYIYHRIPLPQDKLD